MALFKQQHFTYSMLTRQTIGSPFITGTKDVTTTNVTHTTEAGSQTRWGQKRCASYSLVRG